MLQWPESRRRPRMDRRSEARVAFRCGTGGDQDGEMFPGSGVCVGEGVGTYGAIPERPGPAVFVLRAPAVAAGPGKFSGHARLVEPFRGGLE